ncbi:MAG: hypothetical protein HWD85_08330 [Flavobacteriaceae bacterium]|nr:hypothetical protein [Flavobacteriaceae bacterium]
MIEDTGLESLCELANTKEEVLQKTSILFSQKLSKLETKKRHEELSQIHPTESARKLIDCIFK